MPQLNRPVRRQDDYDTEDFSGEWDQESYGEPESYDEGFLGEAEDSFDVYRHFHPLYSYHRDSHQGSYAPIALPGKRPADELRAGDLVLIRLVTSGRTVQAVVLNPELLSHEDLQRPGDREGFYVEVLGRSADGPTPMYVRVSSPRFVTPSNVLILRRSGGSLSESFDDAYYDEQSWAEDTAPTLLGRETSPSTETLYVEIDLGLRRECVRRQAPRYNCIETLKYDVEPKTGIFIPSGFTASPQVDILLYLHGHKSGYVVRGRDLPIDKLWNATQHPKFAFRDIVNASGRNLILVAPTLGTLAQPGSLATGAGFTQFIDQVLAAIGTHCSLYAGQSAPTVRSIILAAHSGGGDPMRRMARIANNAYVQLITECWGFDCTYSDRDPSEWYGWAQSNPAKSLYLFSIAGTSTARHAALIAREGPALSNIHLVRSATGDHNSVPQMYLRDRLSAPAASAAAPAPSAPAPTESYDEWDEGCGCGCGSEDTWTGSGESYFAEDVPPPIPVRQLPLMVQNVPFAPEPAAGSYWPIRTANTMGRLVSYQPVTGRVIGNDGRKFLASRKGTYKGSIARYRGTQQDRWHVGIDLFAHSGEEVVAIEAGTIIHLQYFYKAKSGQDTYGLLVEHAGCLVNYGEVTGDSLTRNNLREGDRVTAGQVIGFISDTGMLHLETYALREDHRYQNLQWWKLPETPNAPAGLLNPTQYLLFLQEHGNPLPAAAPTEDIYGEDAYAEDAYNEGLYTEGLYTEGLYTEGLYTEDLYTEDGPSFCAEDGSAVTEALLRQTIADTANTELQWWTNGGRQILEGTTAGKRRITAYWRNIPGAPAHTVPGTAWSAVFVSTCVKLAADAQRVRPVPLQLSAGHFHYAKSAYNRRANSQRGYYWAYAPNERVVQVGDIIVKERRQSNGRFFNLTYDDLRTRDGASTHGDIVVSLDTGTAQAFVVGGNVSDSVRQNSYSLTTDGKIDTTQAHYAANRVFTVLSLEPPEACAAPATARLTEDDHAERTRKPKHTAPTYDSLRDEYDTLFASCELRTERVPSIDRIIARIFRNRDRYVAVGQPLNIPWYLIAVIHNMESGLRFSTHLHNGDPLTARTVHVPAGRPADGNPPFTWEDSAADALTMHSLNTVGEWPMSRILYELERYNGWGYRWYHPEVKSAYLWSFSNHYTSGKYVRDRVWSATAVSQNAGAASILKRMIDTGQLVL